MIFQLNIRRMPVGSVTGMLVSNEETSVLCIMSVANLFIICLCRTLYSWNSVATRAKRMCWRIVNIKDNADP